MNAREELWQRYATDRTPELREQVILANMPLVWKVARKFTKGWWKTFDDDLVSAGTYRLIKCVESFDPARGVPFSAYAYQSIHAAMIYEIRFHTSHARKTTRETASHTVQLSERRNIHLADHRRKRTRFDRMDTVRHLFDGLSVEERMFLIDYYFEEKTYAEIGLDRGLSKQRVHQKIQSILRSIHRRKSA